MTKLEVQLSSIESHVDSLETLLQAWKDYYQACKNLNDFYKDGHDPVKSHMPTVWDRQEEHYLHEINNAIDEIEMCQFDSNFNHKKHITG